MKKKKNADRRSSFVPVIAASSSAAVPLQTILRTAAVTDGSTLEGEVLLLSPLLSPMTASQNLASATKFIESDADFVESARLGPGQIDHRTYRRHSFRGRAQAVVFSPPGGLDADPKEYEVITTDVSRAGLSLLHRTQLYPGQNVLLLLSGSKRLIEVCWCCRVWPGLYSAGCKFLEGAAETTES